MMQVGSISQLNAVERTSFEIRTPNEKRLPYRARNLHGVTDRFDRFDLDQNPSHQCPLPTDRRSAGWRSDQDRIERHRGCVPYGGSLPGCPPRCNSFRLCANHRSRWKGVIVFVIYQSDSYTGPAEGKQRSDAMWL